MEPLLVSYMLPCFEKILPLVCGVLYIGLWRCWGPVTPPSSIVEVLIKRRKLTFLMLDK